MILLLIAIPNTASCQKSQDSSMVGRYVIALQERDFKTVIDLSYGYQAEVAQIKAQNPQLLWPKLIKEYYDTNISRLSNLDSNRATSDPAEHIRSAAGLLLANTKWSLAETRADRVFVSTAYPSVTDSPFVDGRFIKQAILQFDVKPNVQFVMGLERLPQGDTPWDSVPLMVLNARWRVDSLGGGEFTGSALGGTPPYSWGVQCASQDLATMHGMTLHSFQTWPQLIVEINARFPDNTFPLPCALTVTDAKRQTDRVAVTVPKMYTGAGAGYCFVRPPYWERGQARAFGAGQDCLLPVLAIDTTGKVSSLSAVSAATSEPPSQPTCGDFGGCIRAGNEAVKSSDWQEALSRFQAAARFRPASGNPWVYIGTIQLALGKYDDLGPAWDKALMLGESVAIGVCHKQGGRSCERGLLSLRSKEITLEQPGGQKVFAAAPSEVKFKGVMNNSYVAVFTLEVAGKTFKFQFVPSGVECRMQLLLACPSEGVAQQAAVAAYISQTIPKLASGTLIQPQRP
jgi:hypothetical protein